MIEAIRWLGILIMATLRERRDLAFENLALRQQLGVLKRRRGVPRFKRGDRVFCMVLFPNLSPWVLANTTSVTGNAGKIPCDGACLPTSSAPRFLGNH